MANPRKNGTRQNQFLVRVKFEGNDTGVWDKLTGGEIDSEENKYYPGGMAPAEDLGGRITPGNVTLQRLYDRKDDHDKIQSLINGVGKGAVTVTERPLDKNNVPYGKAITWVGKLKRLTPPAHDSESSSAALYEIEVSVSNPPALS